MKTGEDHREMRYPPWGLSKAIRVLALLPDWVDHARSSPEQAKRLVDLGDRLRVSLDCAIRRSYMKGRGPSFIERRVVSYRVNKIQSYRDKQIGIEVAQDTEQEETPG